MDAVPIHVDKATPRIMRAIKPVAFHNDQRILRVTLECRSETIVSVRCVLRGYTKRNGGRRVLLKRLRAYAVPVRRNPRVNANYTGFVRYSNKRSLYLYPITR